MLFLAKKTQIFKNRAPKALQKGDFISRVAALGAPLELQADFWFKKWAHNAPKVLPMTEKAFKNYPNNRNIIKMTKMVPEVQKIH